MRSLSHLLSVALLAALALAPSAQALTPSTSYPAGLGANDAATADFNGDGHLDVVTADFDAGGVSVLLGDGSVADGYGGSCTGAAGVVVPRHGNEDWAVDSGLRWDSFGGVGRLG